MTGQDRFDRAAVEEHIALLHACAAGQDGVLVLSGFDEGHKEATQVQKFAIGDVKGMIDTIMGFENHPCINLYASWAVFRRDFPPGSRGTVADVVSVLAAVGDMDHDKDKPLSSLPFEAPYAIESSCLNIQSVRIFPQPLSPQDTKPVAIALSIPTKTKLARGRSPIPQPVTAAYDRSAINLGRVEQNQLQVRRRRPGSNMGRVQRESRRWRHSRNDLRHGEGTWPETAMARNAA